MSRIAALAAAAALAGGTLVAAAPASTAATSCAVTWGSTQEVAGTYTTAKVTDVRSGRHACFDRLVVDLGPGKVAGWHVSYVKRITQDGSGDVIPTRGGAALQVVVRAAAYDDAGRATYLPANRNEVVAVGGYSTFRQVVWAGSFEGDTTLGIGVRARLPFRAYALTGPGKGTRVVIDVAHRW